MIASFNDISQPWQQKEFFPTKWCNLEVRNSLYVRLTVFVKNLTFLRIFPLSTLLVVLAKSMLKVGRHYLVNRLSSFEYDEGESSWPSCVGVCFDVYALNFTKGSKMVSQFLWNNKYNKCTNGKLNFHLFPRYAERQPLYFDRMFILWSNV